ncbi:MAG: putative glycolipid-binding domain-containing protein [Hyphomicrobiales bacterium]|nr:putative glycolipid-binding domain-containing protein [Hyphomicrobiales bacterium]
MTAREAGFRPLTTVTARWSQENGLGTEHLTLEQHGERITATAVVTSPDGEKPYAAWYHIFLDSQWQVKAVSVHRTDSRWFIARSPEPGRWCDGDGTALTKLDGCRDLLLPQACFSYSPMIRRLALAQDQSKELDTVSLSLVTLAPARSRRRITCLQPASRYRIEDLDAASTLDCHVDADGLVAEDTGPFRARSL